MISELFFPNHAGLTSAEKALFRGVGDEMMAYELKTEAAKMAFNAIKSEDKETIKARKLDMMLKKKQLGLPFYDGDYEEMLNDNKSNDLTNAMTNWTIKKTNPMVRRGTVPDSFIPFFETPPRPEGGWSRHFGKELTGLDLLPRGKAGGIKIVKEATLVPDNIITAYIGKLGKGIGKIFKF